MSFKGEMEGHVCELMQEVVWSTESRTLFGRPGDPCDHVRTGCSENLDQDMFQWWNGSILESGIHSFWLLF
jgi:hypothetical protein